MKPLIIGIKSTELNFLERQFIAKHQPWGIILFARNIKNKAQTKALIDECKSINIGHNLEFLIDQEGGRVRRLKPPEWLPAPNMAIFGQAYLRDSQKAIQAIQSYAAWQAGEFQELGITINCAPLIDLAISGAHDIIGNRAFSADKNIIAILAHEYGKTLMNYGIKPIIKHIPGHGRANCDSHEDLPIVAADLATLAHDFYPFEYCNLFPLAMTAHIIYNSLDADNCATMSKRILGEVIREQIGFHGLIMSDDLSMKALQGTYHERTIKCLNAGCDLVLHCNGELEQMQEIADAILPLNHKEKFLLSETYPDTKIDIAANFQIVKAILGDLWQDE